MTERSAAGTNPPAAITIDGDSYRPLERLKYGTNPHHGCVRMGAAGSGNLYQVADSRTERLSATNVLDIDLGVRLLMPFGTVPAVALVKHVNPTSVAVGEPGTSVATLLRTARAAAPETTHGTLVTNTVVEPSLREVLLDHPMHVVAARGFTPQARTLLATDELYVRMRSLRLVVLDLAQLVGGEELRVHPLVDGTLLMEWCTPAPLTRAAVTNPPASDRIWDAMVLAHHVVLHCRTVSAVVATAQQVIATSSGHQDALLALTAALAKLNQLPPVGDQAMVVASDGHFTVVDPLPLLSAHGIRYFVIGGGWSDERTLVRRAEAAEIHVTLANRRVFRH